MEMDMKEGTDLHIFRLYARVAAPPEEMGVRLGRALGATFEPGLLDGEIEGLFAEQFGFEIWVFFHEASPGVFAYRLNGISFDHKSLEYDSEIDMTELIRRWLAHRGETEWEPM